VNGQGKSESIIGRAIKEYQIPMPNLVIFSKCYFGIDLELVKDGQQNGALSVTNDGHIVNRMGLSRKHILDAIDASVARCVPYDCAGTTLMYQEEDKAIVNRLEEVSKRLGKSMASVAIAWSLKKGVNPVVGLSSVKIIDEAVETIGLDLSEDDVKALEEPYRARDVAPLW
jgi:aryl-alcohol dehydrogenase-like predicted oxidoreductase